MGKINPYDYHKLIDDFKRLSRILHVLRDLIENKTLKELAQIAHDEAQKMVDDLNEIKDSNGGK